MAVIGYGTKLEIDPGTATYAQVNELTSITLPDFGVSVIEASHLNLSNTYKQFLPGLNDAGTLQFECNYSKATYTQLQTVLGKSKITTQIPPTGNSVNYRVTLPDEDGAGVGTAQTFTFNGFLVKMETTAEVEGVMKIKGEVKPVSNITVA